VPVGGRRRHNRPSPADRSDRTNTSDSSWRGQSGKSLARIDGRVTLVGSLLANFSGHPLDRLGRDAYVGQFGQVRWKGAYLIGRTPIGRVTVALLHIDHELRVEPRESLIAEGLF